MRVFEQDISREEMESRQLELLNGQIAWAAARCLFYRHLEGVRLKSLAEISRLPFTAAEDIIRLHAMAARGENYRADPAWEKIESMNTTTGHYFRGAE